MSASKHYSKEDILNKEQFRIKLSIAHYSLSGTNCVVLIILYLIPMSFLYFCCTYLFISTIAYRFFFSYTKNGNQCDPYLIRKISSFQKKIRRKAVEKD